MKNFYFFFLVCSSFFANAQYDHENIELVGHWFDSTMVAEPELGAKYNACWGWVNPKNNTEYGIIGSTIGTFIIDLSNPSAPKKAAFIKARRDQCLWKEYKTYKNYLYVVSDDNAPNSFQIIDLSYLPDSVHVVYDGTDIFERAHTLFIDGDKLYLAYLKFNAAPNYAYESMVVYSLANPEKPALLRKLRDDDVRIDFMHDMFVRNDTIYAASVHSGLYIFRYDEVANKFIQLNFLGSYPNKGLIHSSALTPNGKTLVFCDEVPKNLAVKVVDVSDISNISVVSTFKSTEGPTPHNPYIKNNSHVIIAYFQDGLQIFDIRNPKQPFRTGFFDTDTLDGIKNNYDPNGIGQHGNWGAYIDFPSGLILASDMQNGLFVLDASPALGISSLTNTNVIQLTLFPNPATDRLTLKFNLPIAERLVYEIFDATGRKVFSSSKNESAGNVDTRIPVGVFSKGIYSIKLSGKNSYGAASFIKE